MSGDSSSGHFAGTWTDCVTFGSFLPGNFSQIEIASYSQGGELTLQIRQNHRPFAVALKGHENADKTCTVTGRTGKHSYSAKATIRSRGGGEKVLIVAITRTSLPTVQGGCDGDPTTTDDDTGTIVAYSGPPIWDLT